MAEHLDQAELDRLTALCKAASPGPWAWDGQGVGTEYAAPRPAVPDVAGGHLMSWYPNVDRDHEAVPEEDGRFIAAARVAVPALIAAYETAIRQRDHARGWAHYEANKLRGWASGDGWPRIPRPLQGGDDDGWEPEGDGVRAP